MIKNSHGILDSEFTVRDIELIYKKAKDKAFKKLTLSMVETALKLIAEKKVVTKKSVFDAVLESAENIDDLSPQDKSPFVKHFDDEGTFTGAYAQKIAPVFCHCGKGIHSHEKIPIPRSLSKKLSSKASM
eukprot:CAMPEP_0114590486 /NCGR_PEP_ID=MMETSP0125-20121206/12737_1 /TAXON_ID=485358 ORGANISM="Aristerostoma sp., Strain ATCC 50986" /NCGR_SAMPLE_ID=MMETSP0125 /ASSEMBLY_ACC=CAM_ASM_000245 /LENGTH=129 /DNA_ID=CAMNT_0001788027 /DNA_START=183 /DNA_END=572 /DNA_ORIENTATION=+